MTFNDPEFGEVVIRKNAWSTRPKFSVATSGKLTISAPPHTTVFLAKRWLNAARDDIRAENEKATEQAEAPAETEYFENSYAQPGGVIICHIDSNSGPPNMAINILAYDFPTQILVGALAHLLARYP